MISPFITALRDPLLRLAFFCILLMGPAVASIAPFQSVIGIERLGLSDAAYAAVLTCGAVFSVAASIWIGILLDRTQQYRPALLCCITSGIVAGLLMALFPSVASFLIVHLILFPISATTFTQYFTLAAVAAERDPNLDKDTGLALVRAGFAGTFAISPPLWGLALARGVDLLSVYWLVSVINTIVFLLVLRLWPRDQTTPKTAGSGLSLRAALAELTARFVLIRLALITTVTAANGLYSIILGLLIVTVLNGQEADIGWFAGGVALVELPVMLMSAALLRRFRRPSVILAGALIYAISLCLISLMPSMSAAWWLILPFGIGAGIILSVPVGYIQNLLAHRPGTGSSLISLSHFGGTLIASALFAAGSETIGYSGVALFGGALSLLAAILLFLIEHRSATAKQT